MSTTAKKDHPELWERIKQRTLDSDKGGRPGQWSARKAQLATHAYQQEGGGYSGARRDDNSLHQWSEHDRQQQAHGAQLSTLSKPELLARAAKQAIRGRSRMNKAQLIEALT